MAYKKFIKKGGKIYGPYSYHSYRKNGKVITDYLGKGDDNNIDENEPKIKSVKAKIDPLEVSNFSYAGSSGAGSENGSRMNFGISEMSKNKKVFLLLGIAAAVLVFTFFLIYFLGKIPTGKVILEAKTIYQPNESLSGILSLSLKEGELIPADSKIKILIGGEEHEYNLNELISDSVVSGDFYAEGKQLSGTGEGYGIAGKKTIYPEVSFTLLISTEKSAEQPSGPSETTPEQPSEQPATNETPAEQPTAPTEQPEQPAEQPAIPTGTSATTETPSETPATTETPAETTAPITGSVSAEFEKEVDGTASKDNPYSYDLDAGEDASIKKESVRIEGKKISDGDISLNVADSKAVVITDYSETEEGFGEDYLSDVSTKRLEIDLSKLDLKAQQGDLVISLVYGSEEIVSASTKLEVAGEAEIIGESKNKTKEKKEENITAPGNVTVNETLLNITANITIPGENISLYELSEEEKDILINETGANLTISKAEIKNNRLVVKFELGSYWIEHSYYYSGDEEQASEQIALDKAKWLKKIAGKLLAEQKQEEQIPEQINSIIGNYTI